MLIYKLCTCCRLSLEPFDFMNGHQIVCVLYSLKMFNILDIIHVTCNTCGSSGHRTAISYYKNEMTPPPPGCRTKEIAFSLSPSF